MLIASKTLKHTLEDMISQHSLIEVLDRLADITHSSKTTHPSQITKLLEEAVQLGLAQDPVVIGSK